MLQVQRNLDGNIMRILWYQHLKIGAYEVKKPMVIGHESAGVVEEVGKDVNHLVPGDRVALEPGIPCWKCSFCREGLYNLCPEMSFFATPPVHGSLADQVVHPAELCFKLPEKVSLEEGAMCEPLSVGVHTCRRANIGPETRVLIIGGGAIGLVTLLVARAFGSPRIIVADTHAERLSSAMEMGADETVLVSKKEEVEFLTNPTCELLELAVAGSPVSLLHSLSYGLIQYFLWDT